MTHALRYLPDSAPPDDIVERNRSLARKWDRAWEAAKTEYLAGEPAKAVCRRHGIALSTFRYHAKIEGWRRCDADVLEEAPPPDAPPSPPQPSPSGSTRGSDDPPAHAEPPERQPHPGDAEAETAPAPGSSPRATAQEDDPDPAYAVLLGDARRHLAKAIRDGRPLDAQRWLRVMRELGPLAEQKTKDEVEEAMDAGVLVDLAGPMPFGKLSDDDLIFATGALRRTLDARAAQKQRAEHTRKSADKLDSTDEKTLDSSLSSPACGGGDRAAVEGASRTLSRLPTGRRRSPTNATKSTASAARARSTLHDRITRPSPAETSTVLARCYPTTAPHFPGPSCPPSSALPRHSARAG